MLAVGLMLLVAPALASACPSLARVRGFHGLVHFSFDSTVSGADGNGGMETVKLFLGVQNLNVHLHRVFVHGGRGLFSGYANGGDVDVDNTLKDTSSGEQGQVTHSGSLSGGPPNLGAASLFVNTDTCLYQLEVGVNVKTAFSGNIPADQQPHDSASGTVFGHRESMPSSLKLNGTAGPNAYDSCMNASETGNSCYTFGGAWAPDYEILALCHATYGSTCTSKNGFSFGPALFAWHLSPTFKSKKKK